PRVAGQARVGSDPETFGDTGPEAFDERVGLLHETHQRLDTVGILEIDADRAPAAVDDVLVLTREIAGDGLRALDPHDVGPQVGEDHRRERSGPDARDLDDLDALERA